MNIAADAGPAAVVGSELPHESAHLHVSGEALYVDDMPLPAGTLHAALGMSTIAHGRIKALDLAAVRAAPGVAAIATAADVPGENNYGPVLKDDPIFADDLVQYAGQSLFGVAATSLRSGAARRRAGARRVRAAAGDTGRARGAGGRQLRPAHPEPAPRRSARRARRARATACRAR